MNESLKLLVRRQLHRRGLSVGSDPYVNRLARTLRHYDVDTVIDVGANVGQYASMVRAAGYAGRILSCEPLSEAYLALERRAAGDDLWTPLNTAVGASTGMVAINVAGNSYSSSIREMTDTHLQAAPASAYVGVENVSTTTVDDLVGAHHVDPGRSLLKIDTQGYEREVLEGAADTLARFRLVQLEMSWVSLYDGQALGDDLSERMRGLGFEVFGIEPGIADAESGRLLQSDVLFARV